MVLMEILAAMGQVRRAGVVLPVDQQDQEAAGK